MHSLTDIPPAAILFLPAKGESKIIDLGSVRGAKLVSAQLEPMLSRKVRGRANQLLLAGFPQFIGRPFKGEGKPCDKRACNSRYSAPVIIQSINARDRQKSAETVIMGLILVACVFSALLDIAMKCKNK